MKLFIFLEEKKPRGFRRLSLIIIYIIIIALFILGLKTSSNNLQQFKYKNDMKQYFTDVKKN